MNYPAKVTLLIVLILSMSLSVSCSKKQVFSESDLNNFKGCSRNIVIIDDSAAAMNWNPKNNDATLSNITSWLKEAEPYNKKIPENKYHGDFAANIGPAALYLPTTKSDNPFVILPAFYLASVDQPQYIQDVLTCRQGNQINHLYSPGLYKWLKSNEWKSEFQQ